MEYKLFDQFVQTFLVERRDFLSNNGETVLTSRALDECIDRFIVNYIAGSDQNFGEKLSKQFQGASREAKIVFAHASWLYVHSSMAMTGQGKKRAVMISINDLLDYQPRDDIFLDKGGIADPGTAYNTAKPANLRFIVLLFKWILGSNITPSKESVTRAITAACLYGVYGQEKDLIDAFGHDQAQQIKKDYEHMTLSRGDQPRLGIYNFLLNLCEPDYYERIVSFRDKELIAEKLYQPEYGSKQGLNTDDQIYMIKQHLKEKYPDIDPKYLLHDERVKSLWQSKKQSPENYWVFQCNPSFYDITGALKTGRPIKWRVVAHRDRIKRGDKVILWVSGPEAGCYALADITSDVESTTSDYWEQGFRKDQSDEQPELMVEITITHNLADRPILKPQISGIKDLEGLKAGNQGTNFSATERQYKALEKLAQESTTGKKSKRYWIYTPGNNGDKWDEFYNQGIIAIGWDELGDLSQFTTKEEVEAELRKISGQNEIKKTNDALANWQFKHEINIGDIIIVKKGQTVLLGYGEVTSGFMYLSDRIEYRKSRDVKWLKKGEWEMKPPHILITKTLTDITNYPTSHPNYTSYQDLALAVMNGEDIDPPPPNSVHNTDHPLNLILFGPPGTGKTYNSINLAVEISDQVFWGTITDKYTQRIEITKRYRELVKEDRIVFTTFHQSMSYEDFIEGIKPITNEDQENSLSYEVVPGIFKSMCDRAALSDDNNFEQSYAKLITELASSEVGFMKIKTPSGKEFGISLNSNNNLNLHLGTEFKQNACLTKEIMIAHILGKDIPLYFKGYYQGVIALMRANYGLKTNGILTKNYVMIIDEINRGNVSQIFGELITLIEPDKRTGNPEAIEITLPYSKESFSVPSNLFIIGTMNTADRSVEALDTALRRRFSFREMSPDCDLLADYDFKGISLQVLLEKINHRIEGLLDKDHTIGHSYFLRVARQETSLKKVFFNEIIPLLQEYFYGNLGRIELVLGSGFIEPLTYKSSDFAPASQDNDGGVDSIRYKLVAEEMMKDEDDFANALRILLNEK